MSTPSIYVIFHSVEVRHNKTQIGAGLSIKKQQGLSYIGFGLCFMRTINMLPFEQSAGGTNERWDAYAYLNLGLWKNKHKHVLRKEFNRECRFKNSKIIWDKTIWFLVF